MKVKYGFIKMFANYDFRGKDDSYVNRVIKQYHLTGWDANNFRVLCEKYANRPLFLKGIEIAIEAHNTKIRNKRTNKKIYRRK